MSEAITYSSNEERSEAIKNRKSILKFRLETWSLSYFLKKDINNTFNTEDGTVFPMCIKKILATWKYNKIPIVLDILSDKTSYYDTREFYFNFKNIDDYKSFLILLANIIIDGTNDILTWWENEFLLNHLIITFPNTFEVLDIFKTVKESKFHIKIEEVQEQTIKHINWII
jgi:hypothetical protein